jgi:hypothetical protein
MKTVILCVVTKNQDNPIKAKRLGGHISKALEIEPSFLMEKYEKFENSYKLEWKFALEQSENSIVESLEITDRLCTPWTVRLTDNKNEIELTFNKSEETTYRQNEFNVIVWANFQIAE